MISPPSEFSKDLVGAEAVHFPAPDKSLVVLSRNDIEGRLVVERERAALTLSINRAPDPESLDVKFSELELPAARALLNRFTGVIKEGKLQGDPLPELRAVSEVFHWAESHEVPFASRAGSSAAELSAAWLDCLIDRQPISRFQSWMNRNEVLPGLFELRMPTQLLLASTLMRVQEHYEGPRFRGKVFQRDTYQHWYSKQSYADGFSYYQDWSGFNFPDWAAKGFASKQFAPYTNAEKALLRELPSGRRKYYVIGTSNEHLDACEHEVAHGLFYLIDDYRREMSALVQDPSLNRFRRFLLEKKGYHHTVLDDELQAYLTGAPKDLIDEDFDLTPHRSLMKAARRIFRSTVNELARDHHS